MLDNVVAIDGPSGSGKSSVSKLLATKLGFKYLDTGAMYRAITFYIIRESIDINDISSLEKLLQSIKISFDTSFNVYLNDENIAKEIRSMPVVERVSEVASIKIVRENMVSLQRRIAFSGKYVLDGRDIGSVVFPNAKYKFYLEATIEERAKRRHKEESEKGSSISFDEVKESITKRDEFDKNRLESPLIIPKDAILIDTTNLGIEDVVNTMVSHIDEIVDYICSELDDVIQEEGGLNDIETDENRLALPTKGVARAVKAKTLIFAASPLFNGGFAEALTITNPEDSKRLFPDHDPKKWNKALIAIEDFITFANANHYKLHKSYKKDGAYDPDQSLYDLFMSYNDEIIWASSKTWFNKLGGYGYDKFATPRSEMKGYQTTSVMQELVDDFQMIDGLSIKESPLYKEEGFTKVNGVNVYNMWTNREPRFYQTVFYQGRKWHISNREINFYLGSHNGAQAPDYPKTGYICYKRASRKIYNQGAHPRVHYRPSIIFRLADFYLLYAETLNEVRPSDPKIIEYVDKVRERAGIPKLADVKPEIIGDQEAQRKAIRMERRIELCTEGQRYFDVRRWMIAEEEGSKQGGDIHGMNMFGESGVKADFYKRTPVETRLFEKKHYLYPIPLSEIQISKKLVQNPLW